MSVTAIKERVEAVLGLLILGAIIVGLIVLGPQACNQVWMEDRAPSYVQQYRMSPDSPVTIADAVEYHKHPSFGMKMGTWRAKLQGNGTVTVSLAVEWTQPGNEPTRAEWSYDPKTKIVTPMNLLATYLSTKDSKE